GGGVVLINSIGALDELTLDGDEATGANIVRRALEEPLRQLAENAGLGGSVVVGEVKAKKAGIGLDVETGQYVDLVKAGIIDPAMVTRSALQNASSIDKNIITTGEGGGGGRGGRVVGAPAPPRGGGPAGPPTGGRPAAALSGGPLAAPPRSAI